MAKKDEGGTVPSARPKGTHTLAAPTRESGMGTPTAGLRWCQALSQLLSQPLCLALELLHHPVRAE